MTLFCKIIDQRELKEICEKKIIPTYLIFSLRNFKRKKKEINLVNGVDVHLNIFYTPSFLISRLKV